MPSTTIPRPLTAAVAAVLAALALSVPGVVVLAATPPPSAPPTPSLVWSTASPPTSPPYLAYAAGAYDPTNRTFVLFGGMTAGGAGAGVLSSVTWVWNGTDWSQHSGVQQPPARDLASIAFDPRLQEFVLFGGQGANGLLDDTWAWNGASWSCLDGCPPGVESGSQTPPPPARDAAALAYDAAGDLVLFGGTGYAQGPAGLGTSGPTGAEVTLDDTWQWTGSKWVQDNVAAPPARSGAVAAYDQEDGTTVLFGGESSTASDTGQPSLLGDTWTWDGTRWTQTKPAESPPPRFAAVADDWPGLGGVVVSSGYGPTGDLSDTWLWRGGNWVQLGQQGEVPPRQGAAGGYDAAAGRLVVFGGNSGGGTLDVTSLAALVTSSSGGTTTTTRPATPTSVPPGRPGTTTTTVAGSHAEPPPTAAARTTPTTRPGAPAGRPQLHMTGNRVARGGRMTFSGTGFPADATITVTLHSTPTQLGRISADRGGAFSLTVAIPSDTAPGTHRITASTPTGVAASTSVDVYVPGGTSARTRTFLLGLAVLIPVLTYLGMLAYGWRRRRAADAAVTAPGTAPRSPS